MPGEKRFGTSLFGFQKSDVNSYIEKMLREFEDKLKEKDDEILSLKAQGREVRSKYDEFTRRVDQISEDRTRIADVLIKAQEQAAAMVEEARNDAFEERKKIEQLIEEEKEQLVDYKQQLKALKSEVVETLKKFDAQLNEIIGDEPVEETDESIA